MYIYIHTYIYKRYVLVKVSREVLKCSGGVLKFSNEALKLGLAGVKFSREVLKRSRES
jgi:hypothetical protein